MTRNNSFLSALGGKDMNEQERVEGIAKRFDGACPQCGTGVKVDEDGCCIHCGEMVIIKFDDGSGVIPQIAKALTEWGDTRAREAVDKYRQDLMGFVHQLGETVVHTLAGDNILPWLDKVDDAIRALPTPSPTQDSPVPPVSSVVGGEKVTLAQIESVIAEESLYGEPAPTNKETGTTTTGGTR